MAKQRPERLEVDRSGGQCHRPQRDGAIRTTGDERARICETGVGELADVKMLEMTEELNKVNWLECLNQFVEDLPCGCQRHGIVHCHQKTPIPCNDRSWGAR